LFGISEILLTMEERLALRGHPAKITFRVVFNVWMDLPRYWMTLLRSSAIGCWLGITPGGAIAASFMGYNLAKRFSKHPEKFGKARSKACSRLKPQRTRPAQPRCCRCWRLAFRDQARRRSCSAGSWCGASIRVRFCLSNTRTSSGA